LEIHVESAARNVFQIVDDDYAMLAGGGAAECELHDHEEPRLFHLMNAHFAVVDVARQHMDDGTAAGVSVDVSGRGVEQNKRQRKSGNYIGVESEREVVVGNDASKSNKALRRAFDIALAAGEKAVADGIHAVVRDARLALDGPDESCE
jgi:hypothetical protein